MKKKYCLLLTIMLIVKILCFTSATAGIASQNGIDVSLTASKTEYVASEDIMVTLSVTNTSSLVIEQLKLQNEVPVGFSLKAGSSDARVVAQLGHDGTASLTTFYQYEPDPDAPDTGDSTNFVLLSVVLLASVVCIVMILRKHARKMFMALLCVALMSGMLLGTHQAADAQAITRTITVSETVKHAGKEVKLSAVVTYMLSESGLEEEISFSYPTGEHVVRDSAEDIYYVDNQVLLTAKAGTPRADMEALIQDLGGHTVGCIAITGDYQVEFDQPMTKSQLRQITARAAGYSFVESAELHELFEIELDTGIPEEQLPTPPNDAKWSEDDWNEDAPGGKNWHLEAINARGAWQYYDQMTTIDVGIIDSMFDGDHEDLNIKNQWNETIPEAYAAAHKPLKSISSDEEALKPYLNTIHGTHVAGILGAGYNNEKGVTGVAPNVRLHTYSTVKEHGLSSVMEMKYAISLLVVHDHCRVINQSMAMLNQDDGDTKAYDSFFTKLRGYGYDFLIVESAGNNSTDAKENGYYVKCQDNRNMIIVVGAIGLANVDTSATFSGYTYEAYSNWGERVDVVAPGSVWSTIPAQINCYMEKGHTLVNDDGYHEVAGTSQATPQVAGIAAMCYAVNPNLSAQQVRNIIKQTAMWENEDQGIPGVHVNYKPDVLFQTNRSYYIVNAARAVEKAMETTGDIEYNPPEYGAVLGSVSDSEGKALTGVTISAYLITDSETMQVEYKASTNSSDEGFELLLAPGTYCLVYSKDGYMPFTFLNVEVNEGTVFYMYNVTLRKPTGKNYNVKGCIKDAVTDRPISGVEIEIYPGANNITKKKIHGWFGDEEPVTTTTDSNGRYSAKLKEGYYTLILKKAGYTDDYAPIASGADMENVDQNATLSPVQAADQYRFVLTWGRTPYDLDSHLSGPLGNGSQFHTFYSQKNAYAGSTRVANLDLDDTSSYGPETTTIYVTAAGTYHYAVHDYSNRNSSLSTALGNSSAKVEVYKGNQKLNTYHVPRKAGTVWHVFEMTDGVITDINEMAYVSSPHDVCNTTSAAISLMSMPTYYPDDKVTE